MLACTCTWDVDEAAEKPHEASSELLVEDEEEEWVHDGVHERYMQGHLKIGELDFFSTKRTISLISFLFCSHKNCISYFIITFTGNISFGEHR